MSNTGAPALGRACLSGEELLSVKGTLPKFVDA